MARTLTFYTPDLANRVTAALREGRSLLWVSRQPWGAHQSTLNAWMLRYPEFGEAVAEARAGAPPMRGTRVLRVSRAVEAELLARIASGRSIKAVCRDADMPSAQTVHYWKRSRPGFLLRLDRALSRGGFAMTRPRPGRPRTFGPDVAWRVLERLAAGESLGAIARSPGMPAARTVMTWRATRPAFARRYDMAREMAQDEVGDEVLRIADGATEAADSLAAARKAMATAIRRHDRMRCVWR